MPAAPCFYYSILLLIYADRAAIGHAVLKSKNEMASVVSDPCGYFRWSVRRAVAVRLCRCCDHRSSAADERRFRFGMGLQGHSEERADLREEAQPLIRDLLPQQISKPARSGAP